MDNYQCTCIVYMPGVYFICILSFYDLFFSKCSKWANKELQTNKQTIGPRGWEYRIWANENCHVKFCKSVVHGLEASGRGMMALPMCSMGEGC